MPDPRIDSHKMLARIARLKMALRRIAEDPGSAADKEMIAQVALNDVARESNEGGNQ
jgi:hypothetical protein